MPRRKDDHGKEARAMSQSDFGQYGYDPDLVEHWQSQQLPRSQSIEQGTGRSKVIMDPVRGNCTTKEDEYTVAPSYSMEELEEALSQTAASVSAYNQEDSSQAQGQPQGHHLVYVTPTVKYKEGQIKATKLSVAEVQNGVCSHCRAWFDPHKNPTALHRHVKYFHDPTQHNQRFGPAVCKQCGASFSNANYDTALYDHMKSVHGMVPRFRCKLIGCNQSFEEERERVAHELQHTKLHVDRQSTESIKRKKKYADLIDSDGRMNCPNEGCTKNYKGIAGLKYHLKIFHSEDDDNSSIKSNDSSVNHYKNCDKVHSNVVKTLRDYVNEDTNHSQRPGSALEDKAVKNVSVAEPSKKRKQVIVIEEPENGGMEDFIQKFYRCSYCPEICRKLEDFQNHHDSNHSTEKFTVLVDFQCTHCPTLFKSIGEMWTHRHATHFSTREALAPAQNEPQSSSTIIVPPPDSDPGNGGTIPVLAQPLTESSQSKATLCVESKETENGTQEIITYGPEGYQQADNQSQETEGQFPLESLESEVPQFQEGQGQEDHVDESVQIQAQEANFQQIEIDEAGEVVQIQIYDEGNLAWEETQVEEGLEPYDGQGDPVPMSSTTVEDMSMPEDHLIGYEKVIVQEPVEAIVQKNTTVVVPLVPPDPVAQQASEDATETISTLIPLKTAAVPSTSTSAAPAMSEQTAGNGDKDQVTQKSETVEVTQKSETVEVTQKSETVEVTQKSEAVEVTQKSETVEVTQKSEAVGVTQKTETVGVTKNTEPHGVKDKDKVTQKTKTPVKAQAGDPAHSKPRSSTRPVSIILTDDEEDDDNDFCDEDDDTEEEESLEDAYAHAHGSDSEDSDVEIVDLVSSGAEDEDWSENSDESAYLRQCFYSTPPAPAQSGRSAAGPKSSEDRLAGSGKKVPSLHASRSGSTSCASGSSSTAQNSLPSTSARPRSNSLVQPITARPRSNSLVQPSTCRPSSNSLVQPITARPRSNSLVQPSTSRPRSNSLVQPITARPRSNSSRLRTKSGDSTSSSFMTNLNLAVSQATSTDSARPRSNSLTAPSQKIDSPVLAYMSGQSPKIVQTRKSAPVRIRSSNSSSNNPGSSLSIVTQKPPVPLTIDSPPVKVQKRNVPSILRRSERKGQKVTSNFKPIMKIPENFSETSEEEDDMDSFPRSIPRSKNSAENRKFVVCRREDVGQPVSITTSISESSEVKTELRIDESRVTVTVTLPFESPVEKQRFISRKDDLCGMIREMMEVALESSDDEDDDEFPKQKANQSRKRKPQAVAVQTKRGDHPNKKSLPLKKPKPVAVQTKQDTDVPEENTLQSKKHKALDVQTKRVDNAEETPPPSENPHVVAVQAKRGDHPNKKSLPLKKPKPVAVQTKQDTDVPEENTLQSKKHKALDVQTKRVDNAEETPPPSENPHVVAVQAKRGDHPNKKSLPLKKPKPVAVQTKHDTDVPEENTLQLKKHKAVDVQTKWVDHAEETPLPSVNLHVVAVQTKRVDHADEKPLPSVNLHVVAVQTKRVDHPEEKSVRAKTPQAIAGQTKKDSDVPKERSLRSRSRTPQAVAVQTQQTTSDVPEEKSPRSRKCQPVAVQTKQTTSDFLEEKSPRSRKRQAVAAVQTKQTTSDVLEEKSPRSRKRQAVAVQTKQTAGDVPEEKSPRSRKRQAVPVQTKLTTSDVPEVKSPRSRKRQANAVQTKQTTSDVPDEKSPRSRKRQAVAVQTKQTTSDVPEEKSPRPKKRHAVAVQTKQNNVPEEKSPRSRKRQAVAVQTKQTTSDVPEEKSPRSKKRHAVAVQTKQNNDVPEEKSLRSRKRQEVAVQTKQKQTTSDVPEEKSLKGDQYEHDEPHQDALAVTMERRSEQHEPDEDPLTVTMEMKGDLYEHGEPHDDPVAVTMEMKVDQYEHEDAIAVTMETRIEHDEPHEDPLTVTMETRIEQHEHDEPHEDPLTVTMETRIEQHEHDEPHEDPLTVTMETRIEQHEHDEPHEDPLTVTMETRIEQHEHDEPHEDPLTVTMETRSEQDEPDEDPLTVTMEMKGDHYEQDEPDEDPLTVTMETRSEQLGEDNDLDPLGEQALTFTMVKKIAKYDDGTSEKQKVGAAIVMEPKTDDDYRDAMAHLLKKDGKELVPLISRIEPQGKDTLLAMSTPTTPPPSHQPPTSLSVSRSGRIRKIKQWDEPLLLLPPPTKLKRSRSPGGHGQVNMVMEVGLGVPTPKRARGRPKKVP